jgi:transcriptional regulator with XRE-family HTH domain
METIGSRIVLRRKMLGLKGKELAKRMGCHPPDISDWEKSKNNPSVESLIKLARALETTETWLASGKSPETGWEGSESLEIKQMPVDSRRREKDNILIHQWGYEMIQDKNQIIELQKEKIRNLEDRLAKLEEKKDGKTSKKLAG